MDGSDEEVRMVNDVIVVAIITGLFSVFGQWLISREREARMDERLKNVEKKLDEHNKFSDKISSITADIASIKTNIENLKESA